MKALPAGSVVVGDRNFGVFSIDWQARQRGLDVVIRMTEERARKVAGGPIGVEGEQEVRWKASRFDGRRQGGMPEMIRWVGSTPPDRAKTVPKLLAL